MSVILEQNVFILVYCVVVVVHVVIVYLHYSGYPLNQQLYYAAYHGHTEEVVRLLGRGADPNWQNGDGWTVLHVACIYNHHQILTVIVNSKHANINITTRTNIYKDTPLHFACRRGSLECLPILFGAGCDSG